MQKLAIGSQTTLQNHNNKQQGFTLIEVLIVLVIIAIVASFALLATGDFGRSRRIHISLEQMVANFHLAQTQAITTDNTLGIQLDQYGYRFFKYNQTNKRWQRIDNIKLFRPRRFPEDLRAVVEIPGSTSTDTNQPTVFINSTGELSPLSFKMFDGNNAIATIQTHEDQFLLENNTRG